MTFPVVESVSRGNTNSNATSHSVVLPATINAGDILIALFACDGAPDITWDQSTAGAWLKIFDVAGPSSAVKFAAYWKRAVGSEDGATLTIGTSASERSAYHVYRISGVDALWQPVASTPATGTSTAPNPASVSAPWGSADNLWIAAFAGDAATADASGYAYPTNYTTNGIYDEANNAAGCGLGSSYRTNAGSSEDVGAWTINTSEQWIAATIALSPALPGSFSSDLAADGWTHRAPIVIQQSVITGSSTLSRFPVLLTEENLPDDFLDSDLFQSDGGDIRFTADEAGTQQLPCEIVSFSGNATPSSATCEIWARVPEVSPSSDTTIYIWRKSGSGVSQPSASESVGRNGTWSDYAAVYHGNDLTNATGGDAMSASGSVTSNVSGKIGAAWDFATGSTLTATLNSLDNQPTKQISAWVRFESGTAQYGWIAGKDSGGGPTYVQFFDDAGSLVLQTEGGYSNFDNVLTEDTWGLLHADLAEGLGASGLAVYINGAVQSGGGGASGAGDDSAASWVIGSVYGNFDGQIDEYRAGLIILSADHKQAEYANQNSPSTFATAGSVTSLSGGQQTANLTVLASAAIPIALTLSATVTAGLTLLSSGAVAITPTLLASVEVGLTRVDQAKTLHTPAVSGSYSVTLGRIESAATPTAPTVDPGAVTSDLTLLTNGHDIIAPSVSGIYEVTLTRLESAAAPIGVTIDPGQASVDLSVLINSSIVFPLDVSNGSPAASSYSVSLGEELSLTDELEWRENSRETTSETVV